MASIRKKRNFKGLALAESPLSTPSPQSTAGAASGRASGSALPSALASGSSASLALRDGAGSAIDPASGANYHNKLSEQLANLELGIEYKLDLKNEDLKHLSELGSGNSGTVTKVSSAAGSGRAGGEREHGAAFAELEGASGCG
jgi:mitogen-activated protein kinase kinase